MNRLRSLWIAFPIVLGLILVCAPPAGAHRVRIVYTNDLHVRLDRLASIGRVVEAARAAGDPVLLVDAGDAWQDFRIPLAAVWGSERVVEWMNSVGYDAMALGNHDLYWGWPKVGTLVATAAFPIVCANLAAVDGEPSPFAPSARITVGALDVLVVGLGPLEHLPALDLPWLRPVDPAEALRREIDMASGHPDLVICLAHMPLREARALARAVPDVDVFVTGHSHAATLSPQQVGRSLIVQSGAFGRAVGDLLLEVDDTGVRLAEHRLVLTQTEAAADTGRGLIHLSTIALAVLAFAIALAL